ncbi:MAG: carboxypeptidase-like regulatory domain-containing protein [Terracidiphilus sp.]|jgi:hypothetical protein
MQIRRAFSRHSLLLALLGVFLFAVTNISFGQDTNASLSGTVTDPSGAAIPGANMALTNEATGFTTKFVSDGAGEYTFRNLTPGKYDLTVSANGFKSTDQKGVELAINQAARVDVKLPLGKADETVTVIGDASLINYENQTLEGGVSPEALQDFPLVVSGAPRSSVAVAIMMPGVTSAGSGNAFNARINGGLITGDEAIVDGATVIEGYMNQSGMVSLQTDFGMSPDITSEVKVLTANYDAQYGDTTSGQLIIQTKSGGEKFHGAGYDYIRNDFFNSFPYGAAPNAHGKFVKPPDKENDFGANIGGPWYIPGFHGDKSFLKGYFYFNWEGFQDHGGANPATDTILSANDRLGNFSGWATQLFYPNDPAKYGALAGTAIPNNQINPTLEDPIAKAFIADLPTPTNNGEINNYFIPRSGQASLTNSENVYFARADLNIGQKDHLYYTYWWQYAGLNLQSDLPLAISNAGPADPENAPIQRFNWEHNFSDVMTNHLTLGYLNRNEGYHALNGGANLPKVSGVANPNWLPQMSFGSYFTGLGNSDSPAPIITTRGTYAFNDVFTRVVGKHTFKGGFEWRMAGTSIHEGNNQGGTFTFNADTTGTTSTSSEVCSTAATTGCPGDPGASFFLGAVGGASVNYYNVFAEYPRQYQYGVHGGDSWRFSPRLTLNYSLRWDYITPFEEKFDNLSFFDPNGENPGAVTAAGTILKGRLAFAGNKWGAASYGARYPETPFKAGLGPRVGFAYTLNDKTVVRAGYGIYYGQAFYPGWNGGMAQDGFNKAFSLGESASGNFEVPAMYLTTGINPASVGPTKNISASFDNGEGVSMYRPLDGNKRPYSSQWNLTIERELPSNFFVALSYVGTKGTHLPSARSPLNILNPSNPTVQALGKSLLDVFAPDQQTLDGISQPYVGWASQMTGCAPTVAQALVPYPMFCGTLQGENEEHATSIYNSFQAKLEHHLSHGFYVLGALTVAKLYTDASDTTQSTADTGTGNQGNNAQFSPFDESRSWAIAPDNVPVTGQIAVVYDLPFGTNKQFLNTAGPANWALGGWEVSPLLRYEYGTPFSFSYNSCITSKVGALREGCVPGILPGQTVELHGRNGYNPASGVPFFNASAFESDFSTFGYTGQGKAVTTVYGPSYKDLDISLTKNTKIAEKVNIKISANFFNSFNNHYFANGQGGNYGGPSAPFVTDVSSSSFGTWNHSTSNPRTIQFAGRLEF